MDARQAEDGRDKPALGTEQRHAEIADRDFHGEERRPNHRAEAVRPRGAEIDQPSRREAEDDFDRDRDRHVSGSDHDAVPKAVRSEHVGIILESDIVRDAQAEHIVGETVMDDKDERHECEGDHPQHRGQEKDIFEDRAVLARPHVLRFHRRFPIADLGPHCPARAVRGIRGATFPSWRERRRGI